MLAKVFLAQTVHPTDVGSTNLIHGVSDFRLPSNRADAGRVLAEAWRRPGHQRVEVACGAGRGRTGTALACLAVLDGVAAGKLWRTCAGTATLTQWKRRGSAGTSPASAGFRSEVDAGGVDDCGVEEFDAAVMGEDVPVGVVWVAVGRSPDRTSTDQPDWKFAVAVNNMLFRVSVCAPRGSFNSAGSTA